MKILTSLLLVSFFSIHLIFSQSSINTCGADAFSNSGKISFTIGQVSYLSYTNNETVYISEGVQQSYEISILNSIELHDNEFTISVYPNPTTNNVTIKTLGLSSSGARFHLYSSSGTLVSQSTILNELTEIQMKDLPSGIYIVKVMNEGQLVSSSKIKKI